MTLDGAKIQTFGIKVVFPDDDDNDLAKNQSVVFDLVVTAVQDTD